jgi:carbon-monoxide dehydrogenase medium subunit
MDYFEPRSVGEALALLGKYGERAKVIAGGTDVMVDVKYKEEPDCLVNIKRIPGMREIEEGPDGLRIGALVTIREIETNRLVRERLPVLWEACHQFASLQIRNTATLGGNVCRASPSGETLAPLLVLEARARVSFPDGEKTLPLGSFFQGPGQTALGAAGILTGVEIPWPPAESRGTYLKHAVRGAMDIAMVGIAVLLVPASDRESIADARLGLGAVAPTPIRARKAEALLRGKKLDRALAREAGEVAASEASPITDQRASDEYRGWIVAALARRGLEQCWKAATGKEVV